LEDFEAGDVDPEAMAEASSMLADGWDWQEVGEHLMLTYGYDNKLAYAVAYLMQDDAEY